MQREPAPADIGSELALAATYTREVRAGIDRIWENVLDWEHLPALHEIYFKHVALSDISFTLSNAPGTQAALTGQQGNLAGAPNGPKTVTFTSGSPRAVHRTRTWRWRPLAQYPRDDLRGTAKLVERDAEQECAEEAGAKADAGIEPDRCASVSRGGNGEHTRGEIGKVALHDEAGNHGNAEHRDIGQHRREAEQTAG
jgi:hypothetical protein